MCEYCGCLSIPAIQMLTDEHDQALDYARALEAAARAGNARSAGVAATRLADLLELHTAVEEQALFPALTEEDPEYVGILASEHDLIAAALQGTSSGLSAADWDHRLLTAMTVLRAHIRKEQDGVFPVALATLAPADWDRLDEVRTSLNGSPCRVGAATLP